MIYLLFAFMAGSFDAAKDTLAHHFPTSIFKKLNPNFWNPEVSWNGSKILFMRFDGWHLFKMLHTLFICLAVALFEAQFPEYKWADFLLVYLLYKTGFNLLYSIILR